MSHQLDLYSLVSCAWTSSGYSLDPDVGLIPSGPPTLHSTPCLASNQQAYQLQKVMEILLSTEGEQQDHDLAVKTLLQEAVPEPTEGSRHYGSSSITTRSGPQQRTAMADLSTTAASQKGEASAASATIAAIAADADPLFQLTFAADALLHSAGTATSAATAAASELIEALRERVGEPGSDEVALSKDSRRQLAGVVLQVRVGGKVWILGSVQFFSGCGDKNRFIQHDHVSST